MIKYSKHQAEKHKTQRCFLPNRKRFHPKSEKQKSNRKAQMKPKFSNLPLSYPKITKGERRKMSLLDF